MFVHKISISTEKSKIQEIGGPEILAIFFVKKTYLNFAFLQWKCLYLSWGPILGVGYTGLNLKILRFIFFLLTFSIRNTNPKKFLKNIELKKSCGHFCEGSVVGWYSCVFRRINSTFINIWGHRNPETLNNWFINLRPSPNSLHWRFLRHPVVKKVRFRVFDLLFASFLLVFDPNETLNPPLSSKYGFSTLFGLSPKFINQLFKVPGFLWPHILIEVKFICRKTQKGHPATHPLTKMTATFFYFDIFQKFLRICVSNTKCQQKTNEPLCFEKKVENRSRITHS